MIVLLALVWIVAIGVLLWTAYENDKSNGAW